MQILNHFGLSLSKRENGPPSSGPVLQQHEDRFLVHIISDMTAIDLEAHNGLRNEREGTTMGSKFTKRSRQYTAFSGKPNVRNRSLLSCFIRGSKYAKRER